MKRLVFLIVLLLATAAPAFSQCSPFMGIANVQFTDLTGAPLTNGALYVFSAGTSSQAPSYQDSQCSVLNTNPVTFTTGARATIWIATSSFFKYVLCSSSTDGPACAAGDTIFSVDNIPGGATSSGGGSSPFTGIFISSTASPATSGTLRLASGDSTCWRNASGSANLCWKKDSNDLVSWDGGSLKFPEVGAPAGVAAFDLLYADNSVHRWKMINNGGTAAQVVASGVDISTTDSVTAVHFGASQALIGSTLPSANQALIYNGSNIAGIGPIESVLGWGVTTIALQSVGACGGGGASETCISTVFVGTHTLVRFTYNVTVSPAGCTTAAVIGVRDVTSSTTLASSTVANGAAVNWVDSGALSVATTAGHRIGVGVITSAAGCTTQGQVEGVAGVFE